MQNILESNEIKHSDTVRNGFKKGQMKRVLVINGHPDKESFNYALADAYLDGLQESNTYVQLLNIADLEFNPNLHFGYRKISVLEPDLLEAIEKIKQADHMVWILPMWWYGMPALMKGFIDRVFLPGSFFKYQKGNPFPKKLLTGKSARLIITADTVRWYDRWFMGSPLINQFKKGTLEFCGVKPVKVSYIAPIKESSGEFRAKWLEKIKKLGMSIA